MVLKCDLRDKCSVGKSKHGALAEGHPQSRILGETLDQSETSAPAARRTYVWAIRLRCFLQIVNYMY